MNTSNIRLLFTAALIGALGTFSSCSEKNVPEPKTQDMELTLVTENNEVALSGADEGRVFTIKSNIAAPKNMLIRLTAGTASSGICYFTEEQVTLPMGGYETKGKIVFSSKAAEALGKEAEVNIGLECEGITINNSSALPYKVKYAPAEKPAEAEITLSIASKSTEPSKVNDSDVSVEIEVTADKKSAKDIVIDLTASRAPVSRYTLSDDQITIKAGETVAKTSVIFHNAEFKYISSKADVKIDMDCKTAKISPTAGCLTVSAAGTTPITIPSTSISDNNNTKENINLNSGTKRVRMPIWNIKETAEDMIFLFEVIGAEYGKEYTNNFNTAMPIVRVPKYSGTGNLGATDLYVDFITSGFEAGTRKVTLRATILSGPARFGTDREISEIEVTLTK